MGRHVCMCFCTCEYASVCLRRRWGQGSLRRWHWEDTWRTWTSEPCMVGGGWRGGVLQAKGLQWESACWVWRTAGGQCVSASWERGWGQGSSRAQIDLCILGSRLSIVAWKLNHWIWFIHFSSILYTCSVASENLHVVNCVMIISSWKNYHTWKIQSFALLCFLHQSLLWQLERKVNQLDSVHQ